ncbi:AAA-ATPase [Candidatus Magnetomorum sp. HK-1]|nr:AAA-ATPase [Candidatus Magnetomorum sp. HK-1]
MDTSMKQGLSSNLRQFKMGIKATRKNEFIKKKFNYTGSCVPEKHYMVDISHKLAQIIEMIDEGEYFTINRPRQYGKTTTLDMLERKLPEKGYMPVLMSFEGVGDLMFKDEKRFCKDFLEILSDNISYTNEQLAEYLIQESHQIEGFRGISKVITRLIQKSETNIVLMIDEVDRTSNNKLFLNFLGVLRNKFLNRNKGKDYTFQSVILAGVHDVKNLKLMIRPTEEHKYNSPWNIAIDFNVDLRFSEQEISTMIEEYKIDKNIKMDVENIAERLYYFTSGYPFLVSKLCNIIENKIISSQDKFYWSEKSIEKAIQIILREDNTNFESLIKNLENNKDLYSYIFKIIMQGEKKAYNIDNPIIKLGEMYGILSEKKGAVQIHNRIYEQRIYNYLSSKIETSIDIGNYNFKDNFLQSDGHLNFSKILIKFQDFMRTEYSKKDLPFLERNGRLIFLAFLKPVINGKGYDFKEVQISEEKRLDVIVTYLDRRYVVELKVWHGPEAHKKGIRQLKDYMDRVGVTEAFLLIFDFRVTKKWKQENIQVGTSNIFTVWV